eukprot:TRINITY_DN3886_c0_g1_i1.p1 TRINITY_DN3886_c0_g1~~TRINITY_DN3886_c0_g1_i1.p1  ORF type:complete len:331 (-),score=56.67 TRINITY_DN3886_c0_g1_i1:289-1281(-)
MAKCINCTTCNEEVILPEDIGNSVPIPTTMERPTQTPKSQQLVAASVGGLLTAVVVCPLDVIKTRLQAQTVQLNPSPSQSITRNVVYRNTWDAFVKILRYEGPATLWRGLAPTLIMAVPNAVIYFNTYEFLKMRFKEENMNQHYIPLVAGALARVVTASCTAPLELLRTNLQGIKGKESVKSVLSRLVSNTGWKGMWLGIGPTLLRDVPFSAIYWSFYELTKKHLFSVSDGNSAPFLASFSSGAIAGTLAAVITTPIDVVKTQVQVSKKTKSVVDAKASLTSSTVSVFKNIVKEEGWRGLTKGMLPRAAKIAPACAIMISTYELIKSSST